jgi:molybdopterin/thiamine biosynthesis adenylyltransferase/proteasome lid subunit RPN8/RPN11
MMEITIDAKDMLSLQGELLGGDVECCAILFASQTTRPDGLTRLLVRRIENPSPQDYLSQQMDGAVLQPTFVANVTKRARRERLSLVFVHSHPGLSPPQFSPVDDGGERELAGFLAHRHPENRHAALVISKGGLRARELGKFLEVRIISLGEYRVVHFEPDQSTAEVGDVFDRQVRAFGAVGQRSLAQLRVAIVGLGGTGSIVAQQLLHLGVRKFICVDPDIIETTNLNRVVGALPSDVGKPKVDMAARYIQEFAPDASISRVNGDIMRTRIARELFDADIIFGCTDSHGSRAVLQQVAYQYFIPCIDLGTTITAASGVVSGIFGRVQLLAPGFACLTCSDLLHPDEVRRDMMTAFERKLDPYIQGEREPAPAVISINGTIASLAMTMFMAYVTGIPSKARYLIYNGMTSTLRSARSGMKSDCYICSRSGALARADAQPLFARLD